MNKGPSATLSMLKRNCGGTIPGRPDLTGWNPRTKMRTLPVASMYFASSVFGIVSVEVRSVAFMAKEATERYVAVVQSNANT